MLVLSRGYGEKIIIGDDITITVVAIQGRKVRLGIEAPEDTQVHRLEISERIEALRVHESE
jgi:carbon storage regulator